MYSRTQKKYASAIIGIVLIAFSHGCTTTNPELDTNLGKVVEFKYDHVANVKMMQVSSGVPIPGGGSTSVISAGGLAPGFWAVFILCSLDVQGKDIVEFNYDASKFTVDYSGGDSPSVTYGPMQPGYYDASGASVSDVTAAVNEKLGKGPRNQMFPRGLYPSLNYRVWVFINTWSDHYGWNTPLSLKYPANPSFMFGNDKGPMAFDFLTPANDYLLPSVCR